MVLTRIALAPQPLGNPRGFKQCQLQPQEPLLTARSASSLGTHAGAPGCRLQISLCPLLTSPSLRQAPLQPEAAHPALHKASRDVLPRVPHPLLPAPHTFFVISFASGAMSEKPERRKSSSWSP